jgi:hypothetical protein
MQKLDTATLGSLKGQNISDHALNKWEIRLELLTAMADGAGPVDGLYYDVNDIILFIYLIRIHIYE